MKGYIYQILNTVNNKRYVGSTLNLQEREKDHFYRLKNNKHHSIALQRAYNKYGKDCFVFSVIHLDIDYNDLINLEQKEINIKSEYNSNDIAGLPPRYDKVTVLYDINGNYINTFLNLKSCCEYIGSTSRLGYNKGFFVLRKVYQYDRNNILIAMFDGIGNALDFLGNPKSGNILISKAIKDKHKAGGYFWSYKQNEVFDLKDKRSWRSKKIKAVSVKDNEISYYNSISEASKKLNVHKQTINRQLQGKTKIPMLFVFSEILD